MAKHNKKRNTGLLYEFLVRHVSERLVEGDERSARAAMKLLRKHILKKGTELYREFRLFHALVNTTAKSETFATQILAEARDAARKYDADKLDREKSLLIRGINHTFKDENFYDKRFDEYRVYATVQTLLNEWRKHRVDDVMQLAEYERTIIEWLMTEKQHNILEESPGEVDDLVVNLMIKKVNGKYSSVLSGDQLNLLKKYVYSMKSGDTGPLKECLEELRKETLAAVSSYVEDPNTAPMVVQKLNEVRELISNEIQAVDDKVLTRFLRVAKLKQEILGDD